MTRTGPSKPADESDSGGRLRQARSYMQAAEDLLALAEDDTNANPIISSIVLSAIAYADAVTAKLIGQINKQDHGALLALLRASLGKKLEPSQLTPLRRILADKDAAQYGARSKRKGEAEKLLADLRKFAQWAESELAGRR